MIHVHVYMYTHVMALSKCTMYKHNEEIHESTVLLNTSTCR